MKEKARMFMEDFTKKFEEVFEISIFLFIFGVLVYWYVLATTVADIIILIGFAFLCTVVISTVTSIISTTYRWVVK